MVKGFVRTLEAVIAAFIVIIFIVNFYVTLKPQETLPSAYSCLKDLDNKGLLRTYAKTGQEDQLKQDLGSCLKLNLNARICSSLDCSAEIPENKNVRATSYVLSGEAIYQKFLIRVWVWL